MTEQPQGMTNQPVEPVVVPPPEPEEEGGMGPVRIIMIVIGALIAIVLIGFIVSLILALTNPQAAAGVQIIRDFFIIAMALEGMLIGAALVVLVLQIARLTNLLQNEIKPILEETGATVKTVKGTASFMSRNVAEPVIRASGFFAAGSSFLGQLLGIRKAVRPRKDNSK
jgi:hypothetical protein